MLTRTARRARPLLVRLASSAPNIRPAPTPTQSTSTSAPPLRKGFPPSPQSIPPTAFSPYRLIDYVPPPSASASASSPSSSAASNPSEAGADAPGSANAPSPANAGPGPANARPLPYPDYRPPGPWRRAIVTAIAPLLGYYGNTTTAIRETRGMYGVCVQAVEREEGFYLDECALPPTFQTWFQLTHLNIHLLTLRLRALPPPHGRLYSHELINHFFLDVEDRIRTVLGAGCPERTVQSTLKEYVMQWRGAGRALDWGVVRGDVELAGAVWRNVFDARGGRAMDGPAKREKGREVTEEEGKREVTEGEVEMPRLLWVFVAYVRREAKRLEGVEEGEVRKGRVGMFGRVVGEDRLGVGEWDGRVGEEVVRLGAGRAA